MRDYVCDHGRAYLYFAESVRNNKFLARKCRKASGKECNDATALMGGEPGNLGKGIEGIFYLKTRKKSPFARKIKSKKSG